MKKMNHTLCLPVIAIIIMMFVGCIHQHPDEGRIGDVTLDVELLPDREFLPLPILTKSGAVIVPEGYFPHIIVEARREGEVNPSVRTVMTVSEEELAQQRITLPVTLNLKSVPYHLTVWVDYTRSESLTDTHYDTGNLRSVSYLLPYEENYLRRDAFFGNASVDLSGQEGQSIMQIDIRRPLANYRIVATDVQEFLNKQQANGRPGAGEYDVRVSFQYFLVTHLNALTGEPANSGSGFGYSRRIILDGTMSECELAADYVLAGGQESLVTVTVEVREKGSEEPVLSRVTNLEIPYQRGHTTTVKGTFLTTKSGGVSGGIDMGVDGDYDGEINIDVKR